MKKKHSYRVPRRGHPNFPATPIFHEASDAASATAQLYSSIASAKAKKIAAEGVKQAERERVSSAKRELSKNRRRGTSAESGDGPGEEGAELLTLESISSLKVRFCGMKLFFLAGYINSIYSDFKRRY